jgi:hypothetical protein
MYRNLGSPPSVHFLHNPKRIGCRFINIFGLTADQGMKEFAEHVHQHLNKQ